MSDPSVSADTLANWRGVRDAIDQACRAVGRDLASVDLLAVGKTYGPENMRILLEAGHRAFGENRVAEAQDKWPSLKAAFPDLRLHLIGPLQTNKARDAVALFDAIETVDRPKLAETLAKEMERAGRRPDCYVEVN